MSNYSVLFFEKDNGDTPAEDFINSLDDKMAAKMYRLIGMIAENGPEMREPHSKHLNDGIFELRAQSGSDITRVLYFFMVGRRIILTNGFVKKTQTMPKSEIDKAKAYRKEYFEKEANEK
jgi:phage-related protein